MTIQERLHALRALMKEKNIKAYVIPTEDYHLSEYVGDYFKCRAWMSGFTGSAGTLLVTLDDAFLWTDGRYFLQAGQQLKGSTIGLMKMGEEGVPTLTEYLADYLQKGDCLAFDGRVVTKTFADGIKEKSGDKNIVFLTELDLVDQIWEDRPAMMAKPIWILDEKLAGLGRKEKLVNVRREMEKNQVSCLLLSALDEIAWLLNLRGHDVAYTPVFLSFMLIGKEKAFVYLQEKALDDEVRALLAQTGIEIKPYQDIYADLEKISDRESVWIDPAASNYQLFAALAGKKLLSQESPVQLMKAEKTPAETENIRIAHLKDGLAVTRFMYWLKTHVGKEEITELSAEDKLLSFRASMDGFIEQSFAPIMAYGPHGAIVHYGATKESNIPMQDSSFCLCDTGGHYREGSTDITRTFALGRLTQKEKTMFTLVLKGHLNLGAAVFKEGVCGQNLDILARSPLWEAGYDYNHGTGHGVGYILSVHEGPQRIHWRIKEDMAVVPLKEGMIVSNEPGVYLENEFGVRHEDLMLCKKREHTAYGSFLEFETLTLVPFDKDGLELSLMTDTDRERLNAYHKKVYESLSPYLEGEEKNWLYEATSPV